MRIIMATKHSGKPAKKSAAKKKSAPKKAAKQPLHTVEFAVADPSARATIATHGLTPEDMAVLLSKRELIAPAFPALLDEFYGKILEHPEMSAIIAKHTTVERQRPMLERYLRALFEGRIDDAFLKHRDLVGRIHDRIDLPASYFIMMYTVIEKHLLAAGRERAKLKGEAYKRYEESVVRALRVDMALVISAFDESRRTRMSDVVEARLKPIDRVMAVIEFNPDGTIVEANENFLKTIGYSLEEIKGKHHRIFMDPAHAHTAEYTEFWASLGRGQIQAGEFRRIAKGGREIWLQCSYNPVYDRQGKVVRVAKFATEVTAAKIKNADYESQVNAIHKAMAVIEFNLDGTIVSANENFLKVVGYAKEEIVGRHHRTFVDPAYASSPDYTEFWRQLGEGRYQAADYKRVGKGGREVWLRASYNPIFDLNGKPIKVVKLASDVTEAKAAEAKQAELSKEIEKNAKAAEDFLDEAGNVLERLANRDVAIRVVGEYDGSYDRLKGLLNSAVENLDTALYQVSAASNEVSTACGEITSASQSLAQATSRSAGTIEEVTSNLQEMTSMATQNARNSQEARTLADAARSSADKGADNMNKLSQSIEKIKASSDETAKIVKTIDDIAFQTNLLALNAAVEAARAGDAGRGFAVVAEEVRNLAMRSAEAARMTAQMIEGSVKNAEEGVQFNREVIENLGEITSRVRRVGEVMQEIAAASEVQSQTVTQVNQSMDELSKLTQQNAATSEETASAAEELTGQANSLIEMVGEFTLSGGEAPQARTLQRPAIAQPPMRQARPRPPSLRPPMPPQRAAMAQRPGAPRAAVKSTANGTGKPSPAAVFPLDDDVLGKF
jgi:methyl-accepting chemotaxis protein